MPTVLSQGQFVDRKNFTKYLNKIGLNTPSSHAVEVGTHRGDFTKQFLRKWRGALTCVDHWRSNYDPEDPASSRNREADYQQARRVIAPYEARVTILRMPSVQASQRFPIESIDLCYLDGCHQPASVLEDLRAWYPVVKVGGVFAGHDIVCPGEVEGRWSNGGWAKKIQPVVMDFFNRLGYEYVQLILERDNSPWSWCVQKIGETHDE